MDDPLNPNQSPPKPLKSPPVALGYQGPKSFWIVGSISTALLTLRKEQTGLKAPNCLQEGDMQVHCADMMRGDAYQLFIEMQRKPNPTAVPLTILLIPKYLPQQDVWTLKINGKPYLTGPCF